MGIEINAANICEYCALKLVLIVPWYDDEVFILTINLINGNNGPPGPYQ